jgi:hypothetical protein
VHPAQGQDASLEPMMSQIICWTPPSTLLDVQQAQIPNPVWLGGVQTGLSGPHCVTGPAFPMATQDATDPRFAAQ